MKKIGIDLDEVLSESIEYMLEYNNHQIGRISVRKEDIKDYYIHHTFDIDLDYSTNWFWKPMTHDKKKLEIQPIVGAVEKLQELKKKGYILYVITARRSDLFSEYTDKWINKYFPEIFEEIIFADHFSENSRSKSEICLENEIFHMIEDNFDYAKDLANKGVITHLMEKPWNNHIEETHENIVRVKSWKEININSFS